MNILDQPCEKCQRKGFTWGRGTCQYCGFEQFNDEKLIQERVWRKNLFKEEEEKIKKEMAKLRKRVKKSTRDHIGDDFSF